MPRTKSIPDSAVFSVVRRLITENGDKAASFAAVARATGLAAPTLVQRFKSQEAMLRLAMLAAWADLESRTDAAETMAELSPKGAHALLKSLAAQTHETGDLALLAATFRDRALREKAESWRARLENALALRLGGGAKGREAAAMLFAAWQGQLLWQAAGGKGFRLKDAVKQLI